jgi:peroxiredoxin
MAGPQALVMLRAQRVEREQESRKMAKSPQVGEQAPDFELPGTDGPFRLSEHRGERVVLLFYPGDNTPCQISTKGGAIA